MLSAEQLSAVSSDPRTRPERAPSASLHFVMDGNGGDDTVVRGFLLRCTVVIERAEETTSKLLLEH